MVFAPGYENITDDCIFSHKYFDSLSHSISLCDFFIFIVDNFIFFLSSLEKRHCLLVSLLHNQISSRRVCVRVCLLDNDNKKWPILFKFKPYFLTFSVHLPLKHQWRTIIWKIPLWSIILNKYVKDPSLAIIMLCFVQIIANKETRT